MKYDTFTLQFPSNRMPISWCNSRIHLLCDEGAGSSGAVGVTFGGHFPTRGRTEHGVL